MAANKTNGRVKVVLTLFILVLLGGILGLIAWQVEDSKSSNGKTHVPDHYIIGNLYLEKSTLELKIQDSDSKIRLQGQMYEGKNTASVECGTGSDILCLSWPGDKQLNIKYNTNGTVECYDIQWMTLRCVNQVLMDCFSLLGSHWYGGYQDWNQYWPLEQTSMNLSAFLANDSYAKRIGGVQERYFINSQGIGIRINDDVPLYISINQSGDGKMCLMAKYERYPYENIKKRNPDLTYRICMAENVRTVHDHMSALFPNPSGIPDKLMFRYPIWSTWAQYHKDINQSTVLEFAENILMYNFSHSQIEIDDDWTPKYGDLDFIADKFPGAGQMITQLNTMGFRVTIWVHPFFNIDSQTFLSAGLSGFLIKQYDSPLPALVSWWDGSAAGILDVSNEAAVQWFIGKLKYLQKTYNISSFKFDAGETNWLPNIFSTSFDSPNFYPTAWAQLAFESDKDIRHQEVRVGVNTQHLPVFVRMLDKNSNWDNTNGLKTLINTALTFGILGYPFILPDMIGGNAYSGMKPDRELFIRWLQATSLMPAMQFSIVPWQYDEEVINITQKFVKLHEEYSNLIIDLANEAVQTGAPIIRPLWWISPLDEESQITDSEFLLGNNTLVAPILEQNARSRNIYLPAGKWKDSKHGRIIQGPKYLREYSVQLDELSIFTRITV